MIDYETAQNPEAPQAVVTPYGIGGWLLYICIALTIPDQRGKEMS